MNKIIDYLKVLAIPFGTILALSLILTIFNLTSINTSNIAILIIMVITMLISGFAIGKKSIKKGYINGLILGIITSLLMFILSLLFKNTYHINTLIYYAIIIVASTVGSMLGINKKEK